MRDDGIHWMNHPNTCLRDLAQDRYDEDEMSEWDSRVPKEINTVFASRYASVTLGLVDNEIRSVFAFGYCVAFALTLHDLTGLPFAVFTSPKKDADENWSGHVGLLLDDGRILDITGTNTVENIQSRYRLPDTGFAVMDRDELLLNVVDPDYREDPLSLFDELEQLITVDFAELVVAQNNIPVLATAVN
jgi:hypothetical protein